LEACGLFRGQLGVRRLLAHTDVGVGCSTPTLDLEDLATILAARFTGWRTGGWRRALAEVAVLTQIPGRGLIRDRSCCRENGAAGSWRVRRWDLRNRIGAVRSADDPRHRVLSSPRGVADRDGWHSPLGGIAGGPWQGYRCETRDVGGEVVPAMRVIGKRHLVGASIRGLVMITYCSRSSGDETGSPAALWGCRWLSCEEPPKDWITVYGRCADPLRPLLVDRHHTMQSAI